MSYAYVCILVKDFVAEDKYLETEPLLYLKCQILFQKGGISERQ